MKNMKKYIFQENCYFVSLFSCQIIGLTQWKRLHVLNGSLPILIFIFKSASYWKEKKLVSSIETSTSEMVINKLINIPELFIFIGRQIRYRYKALFLQRQCYLWLKLKKRDYGLKFQYGLHILCIIYKI